MFVTMNSELDPEPTFILSNELRPLIFMVQLFGLLPISRNKATGLVAVRLSGIAVYTAALWLVCMYCAVLYCILEFDELNRATREQRPLYQSAHITMSMVLLAYLPLLPLTCWWEAARVCTLLNQWRDIEVRFQRLSGRPLQLRLQSQYWWFASLVLVLPLVVLESYLLGQPLWAPVPFLQYNGLKVCVTVLWLCVCDAVVQGSAAMADTVSDHRLHQPDGPEAVQEHCALWLRLQEELTALGNGLSRTMRLFLMLMFIELLFTSFSVMSLVFSRSSLDSALLPVAYAALAGGVLLGACNATRLAVDAVKCRSRDRFLRLSTHLFKIDTWVEVKQFLSIVYRTARNSISVEGFIEINRSTLLTCLKTTVTYLVVLAQFALLLISLENNKQ